MQLATKIIRVLDKDVSSRIAAGEVVDRPVSIVKELVENAIDAGAGEISVEISDGGRNLIRVTDNGCGIPAEQVATAFLRHATSKVSTAEDLEAINTLGFRGEALASIAAVSETEIISRPPDQAVGKRLLLSGGEVVEEGDTGCPAGTTILVTKLFFNTPARLKFLKNDRSEGALIVDLVSKLALAYPTIRFRMVHNQRPLFSTPGKGVVYDTVLTVYSMDIGRNLLSASRQDDSQGEITIYASPPEHTRPSRKYQIFFVNGRYIKSPLLDQAVAQAYTERLPEGKHPVVLLFLDLKPELIDVNVHPHKREIKFSEPEKVKSLVVETIRQILARPVSVTAADRKTLSPTTVDASVKEAKAIVAAEQVDIKSLLSTKRAEAIKKAESIERAETIAETAGAVYAQKPEIPPHETPPFDILSIRLFGSLFGSYLTGADDLNFYLIDQHAAHERIMYETLLKSVAGQAADRQLLLVPQRVEVPRRALIDADNWLEPLQQMGFDLEPFGSAVYLLRAVPAILDLQEAEDFLEDYLETADDSEKYQNPERLQKIISRSCQAAIKANRQLDKREAERLLQDLALCDNPYSCPHGRPTIVRQSKKDIEKWFQRT